MIKFNFPISALIEGGRLVDQMLKPNHQKKKKKKKCWPKQCFKKCKLVANV